MTSRSRHKFGVYSFNNSWVLALQEPGIGIATAPLIPLTDKHNSYYHNHIDNHYHHHQHQQSLSPSPGDQPDFNSIEPHEYPFNSYDGGLVEGLQLGVDEGYDAGNYAKTQEYNHHYFGANHGLYNQNKHYGLHGSHDHDQFAGIGVGLVGVGPRPVGEDNYRYEPGNDIHGDNYDGLIESPAPQLPPFLNLNYAHEYEYKHQQQQPSYFPISPVLKPPIQPHHKGHAQKTPDSSAYPILVNPHYHNETESRHRYPDLGSVHRPIEVHELRDLLQNQGQGKYVKGEAGREAYVERIPPAKNYKQSSSRNAQRRNSLPKPFPNSPFPGMSGIFSPNPGYLVRQKFYLPLHLNLRKSG